MSAHTLRRWMEWGLAATLAACAPAADTTLITDVRIVDGTGAAARNGAVRLDGDRIVEVGELRARRGEQIVEGGGLVLAPGFIDTHSHHDRGLLEAPDALAAVSQGVTTVVVGQDGGSVQPLAELFARVEATPPAVNVASFSGHGTLRRQVMGDDYRRPATDAEVEAIAALLKADMDAGSLGLSTGLEYASGMDATTEEVIALARVAGAAGGRYMSHLRSEDRGLFEAVDEIIRIGREADIPVQVSHMKLAMKSLWGRADELLARLDSARADGVDVTADVYPYLAWQSTMTVLFPDRAYTREAAAFALDELAPPDGMILGTFTPEPSYEGKTLAEVAELRGEDPVTTYLALIDMVYGPGAPEDADEGIVARSMDPGDVATLLRWPHANVCSDGELDGPHPRGFGSFTRVLAHHVREDRDLGLEEAVHKMTGLSADHAGIRNRGVIAPGAYGDLVLFDPATVQDHADFGSSRAPSTGLAGVWVNGVRVWEGAAVTGAHPGRVIRRGSSPQRTAGSQEGPRP
ncbi:MAG: D-aminoacylase [Longimicrobiales bacterium]|nr:D-aminoacylase [Longimicrobiales bacterium]